MKQQLRHLWCEEEGQDLTEYGLLLITIALVAVASMDTIGAALSDVFSNGTTNLTSAAS
jgi:Flp pilus assembly pilin Flp